MTRGTMRLFIALNLTKKNRELIHRAASPLREAELSVRWVSSDDMHVTLKFLGGIRSDRREEVEASMARVAETTAPLTLAMGGFGAFPTIRRPRVLWLGVAATPELRCLKQDLEWSLGACGIETETRAFHPHVTLGRSEGAPGAGAFRGLDEIAASMTFTSEVSVRSIELMQSHPSRESGRYSVVSTARLQGGR